MTRIKYFDSQVFTEDSELAESEAVARGVYVRAFMDEGGKASKAELVRDHQVAGVVYQDVDGSEEARLREEHRAAYPGIPFQLVGVPVPREQGQERRTQRLDGEGRLVELVIEVLGDRGEPLGELRHDPGGALTSRTEYEYDEHGELAWAREYDGQGRLVDEYQAGE